MAAAAQIRALVPLALEAMQTEHEADRTTSIMIVPPFRYARSRDGPAESSDFSRCPLYGVALRDHTDV